MTMKNVIEESPAPIWRVAGRNGVVIGYVRALSFRDMFVAVSRWPMDKFQRFANGELRFHQLTVKEANRLRGDGVL